MFAAIRQDGPRCAGSVVRIAVSLARSGGPEGHAVYESGPASSSGLREIGVTSGRPIASRRSRAACGLAHTRVHTVFGVQPLATAAWVRPVGSAEVEPGPGQLVACMGAPRPAEERGRDG